MPGNADSGSLEFEKVSLTDARKALEETGPAAYAAPKKSENWDEKRSQTSTEPLGDETIAWMAELPESVRPKQLALRYARARQSAVQGVERAREIRPAARRPDDRPSRHAEGLSAAGRHRARDAARSFLQGPPLRQVGVGARRDGTLTRSSASCRGRYFDNCRERPANRSARIIRMIVAMTMSPDTAAVRTSRFVSICCHR